jgi:hypothetical protein
MSHAALDAKNADVEGCRILLAAPAANFSVQAEECFCLANAAAVSAD